MAALGSCFQLVGFLYVLILTFSMQQGVAAARSFTIDYDKNTFLKDGQPFQYVSGSIHYSRVPYYYWQDRLQKMYAGGLNAIQTYVTWNTHNQEPGVFDFTGQNDIEHFLKLANDVGLAVILRLGPYVCGEWEYGGFPAWIIRKNASIITRSSDPGFIAPVDQWLSVLLPRIKPLLYANGGPIIMVQVENEYGSYFACDYDYLRYLREKVLKYLGNDVVLFTTDGDGEGYLKCGTLESLYSTVDFGPGFNVSNVFAPMRKWEPKGPLVNSEYYTGWLDHWGSPHSHTPSATVTQYLDDLLGYGANVNMYMYEGGTNFGFMNGVNYPSFSPVPTSYDYDSPLTEAGDITEKYMDIRAVIAKHMKVPQVPIPPNTPKYAYGRVNMMLMSTVPNLLDKLTHHGPFVTRYPLTMEQVYQNYGFIYYRHVVKLDWHNAVLDVSAVRDRGYVLINSVPQGVVIRESSQTKLTITALTGQYLDILVENQGRINYGSGINNNTKGLIANVTINGLILKDWFIYPLNVSEKVLNNLDSAVQSKQSSPPKYSGVSQYITPSLFVGQIQMPNKTGFPQDTYLRTDGWFKGQAYVNGFNLGRYWPSAGPQLTLYVPKGALRPYPATNTLVLLELEYAPCSQTRNEIEVDYCFVEFVTTPVINATTVSLERREEWNRAGGFNWHDQH